MERVSTAPVLEAEGDVNIALCSVRVMATLENLLSEITMHQTYRNLEPFSINTFYTFFLPPSALLLDLIIKIGNRTLKGVIREVLDAIGPSDPDNSHASGDETIPLEQLEPGLYSLNIGNLFPDEEVSITLTYGELMKWQNKAIELTLPTSLPLIYSDPESIPLSPHPFPTPHLSSKDPFHLTLTISGLLSKAKTQCLSHPTQERVFKKKRVITLKAQNPVMDRDVIFTIPMLSGKKDFAMAAKGEKEVTALVSLHPQFPADTIIVPRCVSIMIDCSGSMKGEPITQAKRALMGILSRLRPTDYFNVILFGSTFSALFNAPMVGDMKNVQKAGNLLNTIAANMGETNIGGVIDFVINAKMPSIKTKDVLLVTDGGVWEWEPVVKRAINSGFRFFTVGVGSAVSEGFVHTLSERTGGVSELVSPDEDMAEKIVRHFKRIYLPKAEDVSVYWPEMPETMIPETIHTLFDQNTIHLFGRFKEFPEGTVKITATLENGKTYTYKTIIEPIKEKTLAIPLERLATSYEIISLEEPEVDLLVLTKKRIEPDATYQRPDKRHPINVINTEHKTEEKQPDMEIDIELKKEIEREVRDEPTDILDEFIFEDMEESMEGSATRFIDSLDMHHAGFIRISLAVSTIEDLIFHGAPKPIAHELKPLISSDVDEKTAVIAFLYYLSKEKPVKKRMSNTLIGFIADAFKSTPAVPHRISRVIKKAVHMTTKEMS